MIANEQNDETTIHQSSNEVKGDRFVKANCLFLNP